MDSSKCSHHDFDPPSQKIVPTCLISFTLSKFLDIGLKHKPYRPRLANYIQCTVTVLNCESNFCFKFVSSPQSKVCEHVLPLVHCSVDELINTSRASITSQQSDSALTIVCIRGFTVLVLLPVLTGTVLASSLLTAIAK